MANIMISSILSPVASGAGFDIKTQLPVDGNGSFALHLDRQIREGLAGQGSLVGVRTKDTAVFTEGPGPTDPPASVEAVLQQLMVDLKAVVQRPASKPGEWTFQLRELGHLEKLAAEAGMDITLLAPLRKAMEGGKGLPLADLFNALAENFKAQDTATEVTVAETSLPLLETFLAKLAVPAETIQHLDGQGVNGVDRLDLIAFLKGLEAIPGPSQGRGEEARTFVLTPWEVEQFSAMLAEAGVPAETIARIIPEHPSLEQKALAGLRPEEGDLPVTMSLDRLRSALQQAVAAVGEARPQADLPVFFEELNTVLDLAGFESRDVGWSPVVQGTMTAAYDELREMIDQAMVRVDAIRGGNMDALGLERMLRKLQALRDRASGLTGHNGAVALTREELVRALQQAVAAFDGLQAPSSSRPELLAEANSILAPTGLELTPLTLEPVAQAPQALRPQAEPQQPLVLSVSPSDREGVRELLVQALRAAQEYTPDHQAALLPEVPDRADSSPAPAGVVLTSLTLEPITPGPSQGFSDTIDTLLAQAWMVLNSLTREPLPSGPRQGVPGTVNTLLAHSEALPISPTLEPFTPGPSQGVWYTVDTLLTQAEAALNSLTREPLPLGPRQGAPDTINTPPAYSQALLNSLTLETLPLGSRQGLPDTVDTPPAHSQASNQGLPDTVDTSPAHSEAALTPLTLEPLTPDSRQGVWDTVDTLLAHAEALLNSLTREPSAPRQMQGALDKVNTILVQAGLVITPALPEPGDSITLPVQAVVTSPGNARRDRASGDGQGAGVRPELLGQEWASAQELAPEVVTEQVQTLFAQPGLEDISTEDLLAPLVPAPATDDDEQQRTADLARTREERKSEITREDDAAVDEWLASDDEVPPSEPTGDPAPDRQVGAPTGEEFDPTGTAVARESERRTDESRGAIGIESKAPEQVQPDPAQKGQNPRLRLSPELQQLAFEQISQGILRGLRNNDHHLAMTLYPKELGEVKVDLQVRGNHLSVTFVMENQKVKEAMEASMGEFKDNLERRGFSLGSMSVSVDQHHNQNDGSRQRFMAAWEQMVVTRQQEERSAAPTVGAPANSGNTPSRTQQGGISLFV